MTGVITRGSRKVAGYNGGGEDNNDGAQPETKRETERDTAEDYHKRFNGRSTVFAFAIVRQSISLGCETIVGEHRRETAPNTSLPLSSLSRYERERERRNVSSVRNRSRIEFYSGPTGCQTTKTAVLRHPPWPCSDPIHHCSASIYRIVALLGGILRNFSSAF